ncbi:nuclear transport factor 2 family protein [Flavobacterium terrisoli]|uniref:nuclear transport factor 2 family protein n=1 Tax=Flavobacterium terrisoli TaxID=3242195 RepID=UPI002542CD54|nr:nuclear transport factor 2 family protein [Flavobacterium buctense]
MKKELAFSLFLLISTTVIKAQVSKTSELFLTMKKVDSTFFERGFNQCDLDYLDKTIHKDLMFYHDKGGVQDRKTFFERTKQNLCSTPNKKPIRKVIPESLEVFPMYDNGVLYGVIQNGIHEFYIREPNKADVITGIAKFTHLYLLIDGKWLLKEVFSFDHNSATESKTK